MLKKIIVIICMLALLGFSLILLQKTKNTTVDNSLIEDEEIATIPVQENLPEEIFTFNVQDLSPECTTDNKIVCTVEKAIKCTLKPDLSICNKNELPSFIFMQDASIDRPTEISYRFINKKDLPNGTKEIYTESSCNGNWFGLCQGTVIYVIANNDEQLVVKDIWALE